MKLLEKIKNFKWGYIFVFFINAIMAICLFSFNNASLNALAIAIGVIVIIGAIILAFLTLASTVRGFSFGIKMSFSVLMLIAGIVTIIARDATINVMIGIFALAMIIDGSFKFHTAAMSKRFKLWCWVLLLVLSVILIAGGYIIIQWLTIENNITVDLLGVLFAIDSIANLFSAFYISAYEKRSEEQIKERVYSEIDDESKEAENYEEIDLSFR
jgi:uncharacterized membrane protein HdeD (DUF308 family)